MFYFQNVFMILKHVQTVWRALFLQEKLLLWEKSLLCECKIFDWGKKNIHLHCCPALAIWFLPLFFQMNWLIMDRMTFLQRQMEWQHWGIFDSIKFAIYPFHFGISFALSWGSTQWRVSCCSWCPCTRPGCFSIILLAASNHHTACDI